MQVPVVPVLPTGLTCSVLAGSHYHQSTPRNHFALDRACFYWHPIKSKAASHSIQGDSELVDHDNVLQVLISFVELAEMFAVFA